MLLSGLFVPHGFLARVLMRIPEPRRHLVRTHRAYSNAARGRRRRPMGTLGEGGSGEEPPVTGKAPSDLDSRTLPRRWATLIKRVYEVDPVVCPPCGGEMRIIAFIPDSKVVHGILRNLARGLGQQPPHGPPGHSDLAAASSS